MIVFVSNLNFDNTFFYLHFPSDWNLIIKFEKYKKAHIFVWVTENKKTNEIRKNVLKQNWQIIIVDFVFAFHHILANSLVKD